MWAAELSYLWHAQAYNPGHNCIWQLQLVIVAADGPYLFSGQNPGPSVPQLEGALLEAHLIGGRAIMVEHVQQRLHHSHVLAALCLSHCPIPVIGRNQAVGRHVHFG